MMQIFIHNQLLNQFKSKLMKNTDTKLYNYNKRVLNWEVMGLTVPNIDL